MEIGTVEPVTDPPQRGRRLRSTSGGESGRRGGGGNDGSGGNNGGGSSGPEPQRESTGRDASAPDKSRVVTWFLLLVVMMTFGGLIGAYVVIAANGQSEWRPFNLPFQVWISTSILFASSITYDLAQKAIFRDAHEHAKKFLIATTVLGATFISSQLIVWLSLYSQGVYMRGDPYAGFFYILTAVHAVHIVGGVIALGAIQIRAWHPSRDEHELQHRRDLSRAVGWYWHFMGLVWIVLLVVLGLWK